MTTSLSMLTADLDAAPAGDRLACVGVQLRIAQVDRNVLYLLDRPVPSSLVSTESRSMPGNIFCTQVHFEVASDEELAGHAAWNGYPCKVECISPRQA